MTNMGNVLKRRDITLPTKVLVVKAMVFPTVIYGCESWTIKKDECWRTDALKQWCWRRLLRVPWTARRSNQSLLEYSTLNIHWKDWSEALVLWPPDGKSQLRKDPDAGKDWRQKEKGAEDEMTGWHHRLNGHEPEQIPGDSEGRRSLACCSPMGSQRVGHNLVIEQQQESNDF